MVVVQSRGTTEEVHGMFIENYLGKYLKESQGKGHSEEISKRIHSYKWIWRNSWRGLSQNIHEIISEVIHGRMSSVISWGNAWEIPDEIP